MTLNLVTVLINPDRLPMTKSLLYYWLLCLPISLIGQDGIQVESGLSVEELVRDVFIKGNCKNVSNIKALGDENISIGQFRGAENIFGFDEGIIISTGDIKLAEGPNFSNDGGFSFFRESEDQDLDIVATDQLFDVTGIEFDFVPIGNRVTFKYVFASEEYCEFVGTSFNDVFGFFVSGPGINGSFADDAINVALLPGTDITVSINTVNHLDNSLFYIRNETTTDVQSCDIDFESNFQDSIEYDGFTVTLLASIEVLPCESYRIRLVIGDVGDSMLDSAVFLESKSFDLGEKVNVRAEVPGREEPIALENCMDGQIVFTRANLNNLLEDCTIEYGFSADNQAINGVDFEEIPLSVTIPAGDSSFILPINIIDDNISEGPESLRLQFKFECDCIASSSSELIIDEIDSWNVFIDPLTVCANQTFAITPEIIGGISPFTYLWDNGASTDSLELTVTTEADYEVTVTDACGNTRVAIAEVALQSQPTATLSGSFDLCETIATGIPVLLQGTPPWTIQYDINGEPQVPVKDIFANPFFIRTAVEGRYSLIAFNDAYCQGTFSGSADVEFSSFDVDVDVVPSTCLFSNDGSIEITRLEAILPYTFEWDIASEQDFLNNNLRADNYILSITDGNGCLYEKSIEVPTLSEDIKDCVPFYIPNTFSPNGDGINDVFSVFTSTEDVVINSMQIFNRWGELIFNQNNFVLDGSSGWRGDFNGSLVAVGVYAYKIIYTFNNSKLTVGGDITLIK